MLAARRLDARPTRRAACALDARWCDTARASASARTGRRTSRRARRHTGHSHERWRVLGSASMSLEEAHGKSRCITRPWLGATRSSLEVQVGSLAYGYVQTSPCVKLHSWSRLVHLVTREEAAASSEKQMSLRSVATPSGNAQRINGTAGMGLRMCLCSPWHSCATRGMTDGSPRCEADEITRCVRHAPMHKPLSAHALQQLPDLPSRRYPLDLPCIIREVQPSASEFQDSTLKFLIRK